MQDFTGHEFLVDEEGVALYVGCGDQNRRSIGTPLPQVKAGSNLYQDCGKPEIVDESNILFQLHGELRSGEAPVTSRASRHSIVSDSPFATCDLQFPPQLVGD